MKILSYIYVSYYSYIHCFYFKVLKRSYKGLIVKNITYSKYLLFYFKLLLIKHIVT